MAIDRNGTYGDLTFNKEIGYWNSTMPQLGHDPQMSQCLQHEREEYFERHPNEENHYGAGPSNLQMSGQHGVYPHFVPSYQW